MRTFIALLLTVIGLRAQAPYESLLLLTPAAAGAAPTYLVKQDFNGTGYDNGESWTENVTPDPDYATSPAPLVADGGHSLNCNAVGEETYKSFTGTAEVWAFGVVNLGALDGNWVIQIRNSSDVPLSGFRVFSDGTLQVANFASTATTSGIAINTTYYWWMRYKNNAGANSDTDFWINTTDSLSGATMLTITGAGSTSDAARIACMGWQDVGSAAHIHDKIRVDDVAIGSSPQ